ncbi:MAG: helix-turn-helix domain-containing protein [Propionibacteriaceae bacterium]|nr:helix-turn-helix domain-containing protein [Micropruina sp.]HBY23638.1 AraC family transcriptional regulator [Propionibacteriaceae bacterium]
MQIAVLVDENSRPYDIAVALEVFGDRTAHGLPATTVRLHGKGDGIRIGAISVHPDAGLDSVRADLVVIPGQLRPGIDPDGSVVDAIERAVTDGSVVASLCTGAFVFGSTGLLDGIEATTHWRWCETFARRYPRVRVSPNVLYAGRDQTWTSAGVSAGTDLLLELTRQFQGSHVAAEVARSMVTPAHRPGTQAQFVAPVRVAAPGALEEVQQAMLGDLAHPWTLGEIARAAHLTERTTSRHFLNETGVGPIAWLTRARVLAAQELLETTDRTVEGVAHDVGFGSADLLRKHFRRQFGVAPLTHQRAMRQISG